MIRAEGNRLSHVANGQLKTDSKEPLAKRLSHLASQLEALLADHSPAAAAVEEVFVNKNPQSTLKLGQARGVILMIAARTGAQRDSSKRSNDQTHWILQLDPTANY